MGILDRLFGGTKAATTAVAEAPAPPTECLHAVLLPHWDAPEDMGKEDRASFFVCESCQQRFSPEEAQSIKDTMAQRLLEVTEAASEPKPQ